MVTAGLFLASFFLGFLVSYLLKMEMRFYFNKISLAIMGFSMPLKYYFMAYCRLHDLNVIKVPENENKDSGTKTEGEKQGEGESKTEEEENLKQRKWKDEYK